MSPPPLPLLELGDAINNLAGQLAVIECIKFNYKQASLPAGCQVSLA